MLNEIILEKYASVFEKEASASNIIAAHAAGMAERSAARNYIAQGTDAAAQALSKTKAPAREAASKLGVSKQNMGMYKDTPDYSPQSIAAAHKATRGRYLGGAKMEHM